MYVCTTSPQQATRNAFVEGFNENFRTECLHDKVFSMPADARESSSVGESTTTSAAVLADRAGNKLSTRSQRPAKIAIQILLMSKAIGRATSLVPSDRVVDSSSRSQRTAFASAPDSNCLPQDSDRRGRAHLGLRFSAYRQVCPPSMRARAELAEVIVGSCPSAAAIP